MSGESSFRPLHSDEFDDPMDESDFDDESSFSSDDSPSESEEEEDVDEVNLDELGEALEAEDTQAEVSIEGDFDRLVQNIRAGDGSGSGMLTKMWNINIEDQEAEFRDELRAASGVGRSKRKKRERRAGPMLSQQVKALIGEGNQAYVDNDIPETIRIMQEVIRIEPRAAPAWSVLAQCYEDQREPEKALLLRIMAAHLNHDAEEWERLAKQSIELKSYQQALYCYGKMYNLDPTNVNALWDRATLAKQIEDFKTARNTFLAILKRHPHNLTVLDELRPILVELSELPLCASLFADAFAHYQAAFPTGVGFDADREAELPGGGYGLMHLLVLTDLYNTLGQHDRAVETIRRGCRWLQGRAQQKFWDACEDDREYDVEEGVRSGKEGLQQGMYALDVNARHRLAVARIKMGDTDEGKIHAEIILSQDVTEYAALFGEIADAYFERELYPEAGRIYEMLGGDSSTSSLYVLLQTAACRRMTGDLKEAAEVYQYFITVEPTHNEAKMKLAEIYEIMNEPRKALELVMQVIDSRRRRPRQAAVGEETEEPSTTSLFEEKARTKAKGVQIKSADKLTTAQLRELEAQKEREVMQGFHRVRELWPQVIQGVEGAEREWMLEAEKLVESFRETRNLFLATRQHGFRGMFRRPTKKQSAEASEDNMASRLQLELGRESMARKPKGDGSKSGFLDNFRTVSFDEWLRLFLHYTLLLTKRGQFDLAQEILRHVLLSNAYQKRTYQDSIRLALITCAAHAGQHPVVVEQSRKLVNVHQFNNEPLRILTATLGSGLQATDAFLASTLSKHLLREVKMADLALKNRDSLRWNPVTKRYALAGGSAKGDDADDLDEDEGPHEGTSESAVDTANKLPTKPNPITVTLYGQICLAAKSYQSALFYLLHAYDYCPQDPMICLCLAIASLGRAMQRQADNRNHLITQGMAFLSQYRKLRKGDASAPDEVEFNFGRAFQQLGLHSLAVKHYERVLASADKRLNEGNEDFGLAQEAAYNLSLIYVTTGATPLAEQLYRRWMSL